MAATRFLWWHGLDAARPFAARAYSLMLNVSHPAASSDTPGVSLRQRFIRRFAAHDRWVQRRSGEAVAALDAADAQWPDDSRDSGAVLQRTFFHLSFGQLNQAAQVAQTISLPWVRQIAQATIAYARGDRRGILGALEGHVGDDPLAIVLLLRAGNVADAKRLFARPIYRHHADSPAIHAEIEAALGRGWRFRDDLQKVVTAMHPAGSRRYLHSETLAHLLEVHGETQTAIRVLEEARSGLESAYSFGAHVGYLWLRTQLQLADLYRRVGSIEKARVIEADLRAALSHADADHPMLLELNRRE